MAKRQKIRETPKDLGVAVSLIGALDKKVDRLEDKNAKLEKTVSILSNEINTKMNYRLIITDFLFNFVFLRKDF